MRPLQNRVTPLSELVSHPARGLVYGNRGCLHDSSGRITRFATTQRWIACQLQYKDWHRGPLLQPGRFTELFFLDEVTAFAAGHRPCALCRRADYNAFLAHARSGAPGIGGADDLDAALQRERVAAEGGRQVHSWPAGDVPAGGFVMVGCEPWLVHDGWLLHWTPDGYDDRRRPPLRGDVGLLTPPLLATLLVLGWHPLVPLIHPSAEDLVR